MAIVINGRDFVLSNGLVRTISLRNDIIDNIDNPEDVLRKIIDTRLPADLLVFPQRLDDSSPRYPYHTEWDNLAAVKISTYEEWLKKQIHQNARNKVRKAQKSGVVVRAERLSTQVVRGLVDIFNETAFRRGRRYSYFGRNAETVEKEWSTDTGRSLFLVAYHQEEIIGFIQLVFGENLARTSGTVAKLAHRDKAPMNALIAKSVEVCEAKNIRYLVYGKYTYGRKGKDSLTEFKRSNGFQKIERLIYYVPLSIRGRVGLSLGLHHGLSERIPTRLHNAYTLCRSYWYAKIGKKNLSGNLISE